MGYEWGGYKNGDIPFSALVKVQNEWFEPNAGKAIAAALAECARHGINVHINEGFRPLGVPGDAKVHNESQTASKRSSQWFQYGRMQRGETPAAAYPGGSIHGWGKAADVNPGRNNPQVNAIFNAHGYVFNIASESWHAQYVGPGAGGGVSANGAWMVPSAGLQKQIQQNLKNKGRYNGAIDGIWGPMTIKGIQAAAATVGYAGGIDGDPGPNTVHFVQVFAKQFGRAGSPVDNKLNESWWICFNVGLAAGH